MKKKFPTYQEVLEQQKKNNPEAFIFDNEELHRLRRMNTELTQILEGIVIMASERKVSLTKNSLIIKIAKMCIDENKNINQF
jgi:hypothetical protein